MQTGLENRAIPEKDGGSIPPPSAKVSSVSRPTGPLALFRFGSSSCRRTVTPVCLIRQGGYTGGSSPRRPTIFTRSSIFTAR